MTKKAKAAQPVSESASRRLRRTSEEDQEIFEALFYKEIESWFSADIACCDGCYDNFLALWPHAYSAENARFQRNSIDLDTFYAGSYLQDEFTKEEFDELVQGLTCPRCGGRLGPNMWLYELPLGINVREYEKAIHEIGALANRTPFLLLKHTFAQSVYSTIRDVSLTLDPTAIHGSLYRARTTSQEVRKRLVDFDRPPKDVVKEGRYNHAGHPVLYLASDQETCIVEMHHTSCIIAELCFNTELTILDLAVPEDSHPKNADALQALTFSALISAPQSENGWHRPAYVFSRFVADCAVDCGIQAIKYPSTRSPKESYNLAIIDPAFRLDQAATVKQFITMSAKEPSIRSPKGKYPPLSG